MTRRRIPHGTDGPYMQNVMAGLAGMTLSHGTV